MGPNFTPLNVPHSPSVPPAPPRSPKRSFDKKTLTILSGIIVFVGVIAGFIAIQSGFFFKPRATGDGTSYYSKGTGQTMSYDGRYVTIQDSKGIAMKLVNYKANQPYWGSAWTAIGAPTVTNVSNGSKVEAPCGFFQSDLIPQSATVYQSPSYNGDRYGVPGDGVLLAAVNGTRTCTSIPTPTPKPPTATPRPSNTPTKTPPSSTPIPSPTPTRVPVCGSNCSSDSQCPVGLKCYNTSIGTFTNPTGKCVLAKCLVAGTVCSADKCTVIPPTPTPTPTTPKAPPQSCPSGTEPLFNKTGALANGQSTAGDGKITAIDGSWNVAAQDGILLAHNPGRKVTVTFPGNTVLDTVLVYDNDHTPWTINGKTIPGTADDTWGPAFKLDITATQMVFNNNDDSPHFNVCIKRIPPTPTNACPKPNPVKNLRINCPICKQT